MRLILLGPPASGKGTQSERLCQRLGLLHLSTGDILREAIRQGTPLGKTAQPFMDAGKYVPDPLINGVIEERFTGPHCPFRFLIDGYPRTLPQAQSFDVILKHAGMALDAVLLLNVHDQEVIERICGRRICSKCGASYHLRYQPPSKEGVCDRCKGTLEQRKDDSESVIRQRLETFRSSTVPVIDYYRQHKLFQEVSGIGSVESVTEALMEALEKELNP
ncbi:MAG TPA: adenylate kinase [Gemmatales bacterium]|nr:adenylate kinase [Gemmatales bacterium]